MSKQQQYCTLEQESFPFGSQLFYELVDMDRRRTASLNLPLSVSATPPNDLSKSPSQASSISEPAVGDFPPDNSPEPLPRKISSLAPIVPAVSKLGKSELSKDQQDFIFDNQLYQELINIERRRANPGLTSGIVPSRNIRTTPDAASGKVYYTQMYGYCDLRTFQQEERRQNITLGVTLGLAVLSLITFRCVFGAVTIQESSIANTGDNITSKLMSMASAAFDSLEKHHAVSSPQWHISNEYVSHIPTLSDSNQPLNGDTHLPESDISNSGDPDTNQTGEYLWVGVTGSIIVNENLNGYSNTLLLFPMTGNTFEVCDMEGCVDGSLTDSFGELVNAEWFTQHYLEYELVSLHLLATNAIPYNHPITVPDLMPSVGVITPDHQRHPTVMYHNGGSSQVSGGMLDSGLGSKEVDSKILMDYLRSQQYSHHLSGQFDLNLVPFYSAKFSLNSRGGPNHDIYLQTNLRAPIGSPSLTSQVSAFVVWDLSLPSPKDDLVRVKVQEPSSGLLSHLVKTVNSHDGLSSFNEGLAAESAIHQHSDTGGLTPYCLEGDYFLKGSSLTHGGVEEDFGGYYPESSLGNNTCPNYRKSYAGLPNHASPTTNGEGLTGGSSLHRDPA